MFDAANYIQLKSGFKVNTSAGGYFRAYIDGCGGSLTTITNNTAVKIPENKRLDIEVESPKEALQVYPNPFTNDITINYNLASNNSFGIIVTGKQIGRASCRERV